MKPLIFAFCVLFMFGGLRAQTASLAAIARTYASADMAGSGARPAACSGTGNRYNVRKRLVGCRQAGRFRD